MLTACEFLLYYHHNFFIIIETIYNNVTIPILHRINQDI